MTRRNQGNAWMSGAAIATGTVAAVLVWAHMAAGQAPERQIRSVELHKLPLQDIPSLPGIGNTFIQGTFDKPGLYAAYSRMAEGSRFPPHSHPDVRFTVVTSGTMYLGEGEVFDEARLVAYPVGTAAITPANTAHYMFAKDGDVWVLEIGAGPSGATFLKR